MGVDNGPTDRQAHPEAALLRRVEGFKNPLEMFRIDAGSRIVNCDEDVCGPLLGDDRQHSLPLFDRPHCFDRVQDQVQDDLLQLNTVRLNMR